MLWPQEPTQAEEQDKAGYKHWGVDTFRCSPRPVNGVGWMITLQCVLYHLPEVSEGTEPQLSTVLIFFIVFFNGLPALL